MNRPHTPRHPWLAVALVASFLALAATAALAEADPESDPESAPESDPEAADETSDKLTGESTDKSVDETTPETTAAPKISKQQRRAGRRAFRQVARVLQSPRCMNCHPDGDRPLQTDESRPHTMNISRRSLENGLKCATCHRDRNSEAYGVEDGPPGAPHWGLPPEDTPMIFEGRSVPELCRQLKDPRETGGKDLAALLEHVRHDPLVLWGWEPGGDRSLPPLSHEDFVAAFATWVDSRGACPDD